MNKIIGVAALPTKQSRNDDDFADRLSYRYTVAMLLVFATVVSTSQYVGKYRRLLFIWARPLISSEIPILEKGGL